MCTNMFQQCNYNDALILEALPEHDILLEQLLSEHSVPVQADVISCGDHDGSKKRKGRGKSTVADESETKAAHEETNTSTKDLKKIMHRDIERQRRQEMSALYASLRSLLPLEYIKGKRSASDHMNEAVRYINDMQKRLERMREHRDGLKNASSSSSTAAGSDDQRVNVCDLTSSVKVNILGHEIEILISSDLACEAFPTSRVLEELLGRGLNVVCYVSCRVGDGSLHKIQFEVNDPSLDLPELQKKVENLIRFA